MNRTKTLLATVLAVFLVSLVGCSKPAASGKKVWNKGKSWRAKVGWKAEEFFDDPKVIALCNAVEEKDMATFDKLLAEGVDVNAKGKGNMTPLLWSFPERRDEYFKKLLEYGADPNVIIESDFGVPQSFCPGISITYITAGSNFPNHFKWVMEHGGDPNLKNPGAGAFGNAAPLSAAINFGMTDHIKILVEEGADLSSNSDTRAIPIMDAASANNFEIVLLFLEKGVDYKKDRTPNSTNLIRVLAGKYDQWVDDKNKTGKDFRKVVDWIKNDGFDIEKARHFIKTWPSGRMPDEEFYQWQKDHFGTK